MLRLWVEIPEPERLENAVQLHHPWRHSVHSPLERPSVVYGQARMQGPSGRATVPRVGRIEGDIGPLAEFGRKIEWEAPG